MTIHLQATIDPTARAAAASGHVASLETLLSNEKMKASDKITYESLVSHASSEVWGAENLSRLLRVIEFTATVKRRDGQNFAEGRVLGYFGQTKWSQWRENAFHGKDTTAQELVATTKKLGGKNLDEFSKKSLAAIWLFLRGDWRTLGATQRTLAKEQFCVRFAKGMRDFEPSVYVQELPHNASEYQELYPDQFLAAFPDELPALLPPEDVSQIEYIDGMLRCRGSIGGAGHDQLALITPQLTPQPSQDHQQARLLTQMVMQQFQAMMAQQSRAGEDIPGLQIFPPNGPNPHTRTAGRPMRSMSHGALDDPGRPLENSAQSRACAAETLALPSNDADGVDAVSAAMLARPRTAADGDDEDDDDDSDPEDAAPPTKRLRKIYAAVTPMKSMPKGKATPKKKGKAAPKKSPKPAAGPAEWLKPPRIGWEKSRRQVMCRTGKVGPNTNLGITFDEAGGPRAAWKKAEKWLEKTMKEYENAKAKSKPRR